MENPWVIPLWLLIILKAMADEKNIIIIKSLGQIFGFRHFILIIEWSLDKSVAVPIKQNHPHPTLPTKGDIKINTSHISITEVITPQYIECQIKPMAKI